MQAHRGQGVFQLASPETGLRSFGDVAEGGGRVGPRLRLSPVLVVLSTRLPFLSNWLGPVGSTAFAGERMQDEDSL